jgi:hypothetical protein
VARVVVYTDESGDLVFSQKGSRYFVIGSVVLPDHFIGDALLQLRRELAWQGVELRKEFHATDDPVPVRRRVFEIIAGHNFRADFTVLEKRKAQPQLRTSDTRFYHYAWYYHMRFLLREIASRNDEVLIVAAAIGTKDRYRAFRGGIDDVLRQTSPTPYVRASFWPSAVDPCLQVADYCCWAVFRKWEANDAKWYVYIQEKVKSEFDLFRRGSIYYY